VDDLVYSVSVHSAKPRQGTSSLRRGLLQRWHRRQLAAQHAPRLLRAQHLFPDTVVSRNKNTRRIGKSQSKRPHRIKDGDAHAPGWRPPRASVPLCVPPPPADRDHCSPSSSGRESSTRTPLDEPPSRTATAPRSSHHPLRPGTPRPRPDSCSCAGMGLLARCCQQSSCAATLARAFHLHNG
jgi:hypothetical protein